MSSYTVVGAVQKQLRPNGKQIIGLNLENGEGNQQAAEWYTNADTALPQIGSALEGDLVYNQQWQRFDFKKAQQQQGGFGGGQRSGGRPGDDPATRESIQKQTALKAAVEYHHGDGKPPIDVVATAQIFTEWLAQAPGDQPPPF